MEKKNKRILILSVVVCLLPMTLGITLYNKLPEQIPIHFGMGDIPDNYASKNFALFGIPTIMAIVQFLCMLSTVNRFKDVDKPKFVKIMEWFIPIITVALYIIMIEVPLGSTVYVGKSVCLILGILFIIIGNYLPKISYEVGNNIIHPTPKDEKSFRKMTRGMGYSLLIIGIFFLVMIIWV